MFVPLGFINEDSRFSSFRYLKGKLLGWVRVKICILTKKWVVLTSNKANVLYSNSVILAAYNKK